MVGFGHHAPSGEEFARAQFVQTFGGVLCESDPDQDAAHASRCPACLIVSAFIPPQPTAEVEWLAFASSEIDWRDTGLPAAPPTLTERPPKRGPPLA